MSVAANLTLIYDNFADAAALSGGQWQTGSLRLDNLRTPYFAEVARSASTDPAATRFNVDLAGLPAVGGIAVGPCSVSAYAQVRVRAYFDGSRTQLAYDSGFVGLPGSQVDQDLLAWEDPGFWEGISADFNDLGKGSIFFHLPPTPVTAQAWTVEIDDRSNIDGHIDIGRLFMGRVWQPTSNYGYDNNSLDFDSLTDVEESRSGVRFFNARNIRRSLSFTFDYLPDAATFRDVYRIATHAGTHNQVAVIPDPDDLDSYQREAFIGTLGQPPSLRRPAFGFAATAFKIEESL